ncbi:hypothetical protein TUM19329_01410 [Legionella antarctica]|uniref:LidA long coiled-coil domain-containing protein n=1 Tax=Legionella antarctica TaxID=2708020 RepID=A0A6F8T0U8_9GAMM|nr:hypothetical protein [Legionella antarctica]BCA93780.1 hypothetical protein TUM19329_01410 [Legionella antarctica]
MANDSERIEEEVGRLGLQTPSTVDALLKTKVGASIVAQLIEAIVKKMVELQNFTQEMTKKAAESSFLRGLREEEEDKEADTKKEMFNLQPITPLSPPMKPKDMETTIGAQIQDLNEELDDVNDEIEQKTKLYDDYDKNIKEVDKFVKTVDLNDKTKALASIESELSRLEGSEEERGKEAAAIDKLINDGQIDEAKKRVNVLNAKNIQIGTLKDMLSVVKGAKVMYNKNGEEVKSFDKADFVVPKDKKIVKEGDEYFLLDKNDELSATNRDEAKAAFEREEPEMSSVKNLINTNRDSEMTELNQELERISAKIKDLQSSSVQSPSTLSQMPDNPGQSRLEEETFSSLAPLTQESSEEDEDLDLSDIDNPHL